jgi:hypothetical protein
MMIYIVCESRTEGEPAVWGVFEFLPNALHTADSLESLSRQRIFIKYVDENELDYDWREEMDFDYYAEDNPYD